MKILLISLVLFSAACLGTPGSGENPVPVVVSSEGSTTKTLYIVRHAKSDKDDPTIPDFDRPLKERGEEDAPFMGQKLLERDLGIDLIITSPANRAQTTARLIAEELGYPQENIVLDSSLYGSTTEHYMNRVREIEDQYDNVMIVAHNNFSTNACNFFQPDTIIAELPTTGIFSISFDTEHWAEAEDGSGTFNFMDYPKRYPERQ